MILGKGFQSRYTCFRSGVIVLVIVCDRVDPPLGAAAEGRSHRADHARLGTEVQL